MTALQILADGVWLIGLFVTVVGLWFSAGGMRVIVSGRIDERRSSSKSLKLGLPLLALGIALLSGGIWFVNWVQGP